MKSTVRRRVLAGLAGVAAAGITASGVAAPTLAADAQVADSTNHSHERTRDKSTLGPKSYKGLRLGMSKKQALKTGLLRNPQKIRNCTWYYLKRSEGVPNPGNGVVISPKRGVVNISGTNTMHTPEGIRMGSVGEATGSLARRIEHRYKRYAVDRRLFPMYHAPTPGNRRAHYSFAMGQDHRVKDLTLTLNKPGCGLATWPY